MWRNQPTKSHGSTFFHLYFTKILCHLRNYKKHVKKSTLVTSYYISCIRLGIRAHWGSFLYHVFHCKIFEALPSNFKPKHVFLSKYEGVQLSRLIIFYTHVRKKLWFLTLCCSQLRTNCTWWIARILSIILHIGPMHWMLEKYGRASTQIMKRWIYLLSSHGKLQFFCRVMQTQQLYGKESANIRNLW